VAEQQRESPPWRHAHTWPIRQTASNPAIHPSQSRAADGRWPSHQGRGDRGSRRARTCARKAPQDGRFTIFLPKDLLSPLATVQYQLDSSPQQNPHPPHQTAYPNTQKTTLWTAGALLLRHKSTPHQHIYQGDCDKVKGETSPQEQSYHQPNNYQIHLLITTTTSTLLYHRSNTHPQLASELATGSTQS